MKPAIIKTTTHCLAAAILFFLCIPFIATVPQNATEGDVEGIVEKISINKNTCEYDKWAGNKEIIIQIDGVEFAFMCKDENIKVGDKVRIQHDEHRKIISIETPINLEAERE